MAGAKKSEGVRDEPPAIHLRAASGQLIRFTLPLHEAISAQWRNGELQRVSEDGGPFAGDQYALDELPGAAGGSSGDGAADKFFGPVRPAADAPVKAWRDYAVAIGACTPDVAAATSRPDVIAKCTPPEMQPGA